MKYTLGFIILLAFILCIPRSAVAGCGATNFLREDYADTHQCTFYPGGSFVKRVFYEVVFGNGHP